MSELIGILTCPKCKNEQKTEIPTNMCMNSYECINCKKIITAQKSCCIFCDYGDRKCPIAEESPK